MMRKANIWRCLWPVAAALSAAPAASTPLIVPFDFSRAAIGLNVAVRGESLYVILDTGVDPSIVDLARADALGLKVDRTNGGAASGFGDGKGAAVFPSRISGLAIRGHAFASFEALASDMGALSNHYGRKLDAVLGYSFLSNKIVLIDYPRRTLEFLDERRAAPAAVKACRSRWSTPLETVDSFPVLSGFRLGPASGRVSLDTGSNGGIGLFPKALESAALRAALIRRGMIVHSGARGDARAVSYTLPDPVGFGPFTLKGGQVVTLHGGASPADGRIANIGNRLFAAMKIKMLLDYRRRTMTFYGDCG